MSEKTIGVAVVGTGFGQKIHIPGLQHHHRTDVVAVWNRNLDKAQQIAQDYNIPHAMDDLEAILALPEVDAVTVATPPFLHYEMGKRVLNGGKHLLLEKPMTLKAEETQELYTLAREKGLMAVADFEFRFVPEWLRFAEMLSEVGKIRLVKIDWLVVSRANPDRAWNWYAQKEKGGGALGAIGSHAFDYIRWLFGEVRRLCGYLNCAIPQRPDPKEGGQLKPVDADDTGLVMMELTDGTPVQLALSSVTYAGRGHWLEVYGDRGTLVLGSDNLKDYVHGFVPYFASAGEPLQVLEVPKRLQFPQVFDDGRLAPFVRVVDHWVYCIDSGMEKAPSLREGVYSQLLMDLTHESHEKGCWVDVPSWED
ncbi:Gfo/Idh/MocA family oxidoreductase [Spirulina sp. CS-785/01]|uniref:Gfo/Idh/MocA family protein n=1 Tax=Spirulina sp. CS-785/01 TaxID=3021716 RepID=UPI00232DCB07|nr:Gfo/Idh/MocA family oxidoreductase [Spirulina sp. CS-785/01]MDB9315986.1 Gfo/Idh/MocA family oxidoreductase [Spirulina sp. CS-785/01]